MNDKVEEDKKPVDFDTAVKDFEAWLQSHDGVTIRTFHEPALSDLANKPGYYMDRGEAAHTPRTNYTMKDDDLLNGVEFKELRFSGREGTRELSDDLDVVASMDKKEELQVLLSDSGHYRADKEAKENDTVAIKDLVEAFKGNLQKVDNDHKPQAFTQSEVDAATADTFKGFEK